MEKKNHKNLQYVNLPPCFFPPKIFRFPGEAKKEAERISHWTTAVIATISSLPAEEWMAWVRTWARGRRWHSLPQPLPVACKKGWAGETLWKICRWRKLSNAMTAARNATCEKQILNTVARLGHWNNKYMCKIQNLQKLQTPKWQNFLLHKAKRRPSSKCRQKTLMVNWEWFFSASLAWAGQMKLAAASSWRDWCACVGEALHQLQRMNYCFSSQGFYW